jgi:hypothetical protein
VVCVQIGDVDWRVPANQSLTGVPSLALSHIDRDGPIVTRFVSSAFSDEASCIVATNRVPLRLLAAETASRICGRGDGGGASQPSSGVPHCVPEHEWQALFNSSAPAPLGPMMDFLFRPQRAFLRTVLVPMLQPLPAWNCPGVRVGVHFRTFNADQYVRTLLSCAYVLVTVCAWV